MISRRPKSRGMEPSHEYVPGIPRGVSDRHCHSGSGYGYPHPKHAFRRSRRRSVHGPQNCEGPDDLGFRDKPGYRRSPGRFRAAVPGRQICRGRLPGLPRHPGVAGGRAADRPGAFDPPGREAAPVAMGGLSAGSGQRSRQSEDGDLLRQPTAAVCRPRRSLGRGVHAAGDRLCSNDLLMAGPLFCRPRQTRGSSCDCLLFASLSKP